MVGSKKAYHLVLDPAGQLKSLESLEVWLDAVTFSPVRLHTRDVGGNDTEYEISSVRRNPELQASDFRFETPEGVEVIDMR